jgi:hypothetical protein
MYAKRCPALSCTSSQVNQNKNKSFFFFFGGGGGSGSVVLRQSCYTTQAGLKLKILLPQPPKSWGSRHAPSCLAFRMYFLKLLQQQNKPPDFKMGKGLE